MQWAERSLQFTTESLSVYRAVLLLHWPSCDGVHLQISRPGVESCFPHGEFSGSSHTSDLKIGSSGAAMPRAWWYRVSTGTGWSGVNILWLDDRMFDLQLQSQCGSTYNCQSLLIPGIHLHAAGMLSNQQTTTSSEFPVVNHWPSPVCPLRLSQVGQDWRILMLRHSQHGLCHIA